MPLDPAPKRKILVVDDNTDAAESLALLLRRLGHEVETAYDGPLAVAAARRVRPDIIFLDLALPGFDGFRVAKEIRSDSSSARTIIVAITGLAAHADRVQAAEIGIDVYVVKPVDVRFIESFVGNAQSKP